MQILLERKQKIQGGTQKSYKIHLQGQKLSRGTKEQNNNAEERISDLEDRIMEITKSGQQTENQMKKHKRNIRVLWDNHNKNDKS